MAKKSIRESKFVQSIWFPITIVFAMIAAFFVFDNGKVDTGPRSTTSHSSTPLVRGCSFSIGGSGCQVEGAKGVYSPGEVRNRSVVHPSQLAANQKPEPRPRKKIFERSEEKTCSGVSDDALNRLACGKIAKFLLIKVLGSGHRCDSITSINQGLFSDVWTIRCNEYRYSFDVEDRGGRWTVTVN